MYKHLFRTLLGVVGVLVMLSLGVVSAQEVNKDIVIEATATAANQTLKINKYFANAYTVDWGDGSPVQDLTGDTVHTYSVASGYTITLSLTGTDTRWRFRNVSKPLVPTNGTTMTGVKIISMPSLASGFGVKATAPGTYFFNSFNIDGEITSLPTGSFDTSNITTAEGAFFSKFNQNGKLTSLPDGSFNTSNISGTVSTHIFSHFNHNGNLTSLPTGSFDTSNITTVGFSFFSCFNQNGKLTSLPTGSFDISNITTVGNYFFQSFNQNGKLTSLPTGSFDASNITTVGNGFFQSFNQNGKLGDLPESFKLISAAYNKANAYTDAFNSTVTINKKVSDIVSGVTAPSSDRNTFSDNQLGRCGVHENWLVNAADACNVKYDANGGAGTITGGYVSNATGVVPGSGIDLPTREGFVLSGWLDASGNIVDEIVFPDMDGQTLYAQWAPNEYAIVFVDGSGTETDVIYTGAYESTVATEYPEWTKEGYTIHWDKEIPNTMPLSGETITANWTANPDTPYSIEYYFENVEGTDYELSGSLTENLSGTTDTTATAEIKGFSGFAFSGDYLGNMTTGNINGSGDLVLRLYYDRLEYKLSFVVDGNVIQSGDVKFGATISKPSNPIKNGYKFIGWDLEVPAVMPAEDMTIKALWEKYGSSGGGGGSNKSSSDVISNDSEKSTEQKDGDTGMDSSAEPQNDDQNAQDSQQGEQASADTSEGQNNSEGISTYSTEFQQAYEFAKGKGITTMDTIDKANMNGKLTRIAMAKMLSQYAMNVLGQKPANIVVPNFDDVTDKQNFDYDDGVILAYQLGIMGINMPNNCFRPNDEVTRGEFVTALSRMLYNTSDGEYKSTPKYYINHMKKMKEEGIITKDDPNMKELRGYVMIMLMRSAK